MVASLPNGVDTVIGEDGGGISGGERQRIALARALYKSPKLLILDEATSSLDNQTEREILDTIFESQRDLHHNYGIPQSRNVTTMR